MCHIVFLCIYVSLLSLPLALLDVDDAMTAESRTPNTTPPERRRENVSELSDVLEALQMVGRRNSQPVSTKTSYVFLHEYAPVVYIASPSHHSMYIHCIFVCVIML